MSKQKMRGAFAILLSVVMLLGSVSMGVFAAETDPEYEVVASKTVDWYGIKHDEAREEADPEGTTYVFWNVWEEKDFDGTPEAVSLKDGEKLYVVLDPINAEGVLNEAGAFGLEAFVEIYKEGQENAVAGTWGGNPAGGGLAFKFSYSEVADLNENGDNAADLLLENLGDATAEPGDYPGDENLTARIPMDEAIAESGAGFVNLGYRGALATAVTDTLYIRPVLEYTAQSDGDYTVIFKEAKFYGQACEPDFENTLQEDNNSVAVSELKKTVTAYVLAPKAEEGTSSTPENTSSAPENTSSTPAEGTSSTPENTSSAPENTSSAPACEHKNATEVADTAKAATCTEAGQKADKVCPDCEETIKGEEIAALGHDFGEDNDEPLCSVCGERNEDYVYVPSGPYYAIALETTADHHDPCDGNLFESDEYVTLKQGQKMYIVLDPVDAEGNPIKDTGALLECASLSVQSAAGVEYATFGKGEGNIAPVQGENGFTYGYSYTLLKNWTADAAKDLLLDNYGEMVWQPLASAPISGTSNWWGVKATDDLTFPKYLAIVGDHFGSLVSQADDTMIARAVLVFEAPSDGKFKIVTQYKEWGGDAEAQVYVLTEEEAPVDPTPDNSKPDSNKPGSPTTGVDTFVWPVALVALVTMAAGVVLCTKKSRAK